MLSGGFANAPVICCTAGVGADGAAHRPPANEAPLVKE